MELRKQKEMEFHNKREEDRLKLDDDMYQNKYSNKKFYSIVRKSRNYILDWMRQNCQGRTALDYCCGLGNTSLELAEHGAFVYGIDISDESVKTAARRLVNAGYEKQSEFQVMDAEKLEFDDNFFDVIVCNGVLHHLDLTKAFPELARVLKPDGKIICIEALGYNPIINWYRKKTPDLRTEWEAEHILTLKEVEQAKAYFDRVSVKFFHFFSIIAVPFRNAVFFEPLLTFLEGIDRIILEIPLVKLIAWQMIFELSGSCRS